MRRFAALLGTLMLVGACTSAGGAHSPRVLTARIVLDATSVRAGQPIRGQLVLRNNTGKRITYCNGVARIGLTKPGVPFEPIEPAIGCLIGRTPSIPTGTSRWSVAVSTRYEDCTTSHPTAALPLCAKGPTGAAVIPRLPVGHYRTIAVWHFDDTVHPIVAAASVDLTG